LGTEVGCKNTLFLNVATKKRKIFSDFFVGFKLVCVTGSLSILVEP
jgi:hypothetical protein